MGTALCKHRLIFIPQCQLFATKNSTLNDLSKLTNNQRIATSHPSFTHTDVFFTYVATQVSLAVYKLYWFNISLALILLCCNRLDVHPHCKNIHIG